MESKNVSDVFKINRLLHNVNIKTSCYVENGLKALTAFITSDGDVVLHYGFGNLPKVIKRINWYTDNSKSIETMCFDPTATWLLTVCCDGSLHIVPALSLVDKNQKVDCKWSISDITHFPNHANACTSRPLSVIWWQTLDCNQNAIVGFENGAIKLISLTDGRCLSVTAVSDAASHLHFCFDNSLDSVFALITSDTGGQQWRLLLEQRSTSYVWPTETSKPSSLSFLNVDKFSIMRHANHHHHNHHHHNNHHSNNAAAPNHNYDPEPLPPLCDTHFCAQYAHNRHTLSAYYEPMSLLTIHIVENVDTAPLFVYKLPPSSNKILLTDHLIYCVNPGKNGIFICSNRLAECRLDCDKEFKPEALIAEFKLTLPEERILDLYRITDLTLVTERQTRDLGKARIDTCIIITTHGVYEIAVRCPIIEKFTRLITEDWDLENAEKWATLFGINLNQNLENCGDILIAQGSFHQGLLLYKHARVHLLKRVLKLAVSGNSKALLRFINICLNNKAEMSIATKIHCGNLMVMAYTELLLRHLVCYTEEFTKFLRHGEYYDQVLAVNVVCQAGLWNIVSILVTSRGLQPEVVSALAQILSRSRSHSSDEFYAVLSDPTLAQSLVANRNAAEVLLNFVQSNVDAFPVDVLHRFVLQLDPSQPVTASYKPDALFIDTLLSVLLVFVQKTGSMEYDADLLRLNAKEQMCVEEPVRRRPLSCGYEHAAVVRNDCVYVMGISNSGCLGVGPLLTQTSPPKLVNTLSELNVRAYSVSCGRKHTLLLTDHGLFSWGSNNLGQLGLGPSVLESPYPQMIVSVAMQHIIDIVAGQYHNLALTARGEVYTWGWSVHGQLGHGSSKNEFFPRRLNFPQKVIQVTAGHAHSLLLCTDGLVYGFGCTTFGQLGDETNGKHCFPVKLAHFTEDMLPIKAIASGYFHNIAVSNDNKLYTWGASPQDIRMTQNRGDGNLEDTWKKCTLVECANAGNNSGHLDQICAGFRHSSVLQAGKIYSLKNMETACVPNQDHIGPITYVSCGSDYTMAIESTGRLLAWGSNYMAHTLLGKPAADGEHRQVITFKNSKRLLKVPSTPFSALEVPGLPTLAITYNEQCTRKIRQCSTVLRVENDDADRPYNVRFGNKTLHFVLETYYDHYDVDKFLAKALQCGNLQAASKVSMLDGHFGDSLTFQLSALAKDIGCYEPGLSSSSSLDSVWQFGDQGGYESPCELSDVRQTVLQYVQSTPNMSDLMNDKTYIASHILDNSTEIVEFYLMRTHDSENHILMQNILMKCIEFWVSNSMPIVVLEGILLKNVDKYFYPLSVLLFCKNFNNSLDENSDNKCAGFLKHFSTKFCLQLCSMLLDNVNKT